MYRAPDATPRCPLCTSTSLTPPTMFVTMQSFPKVRFHDAAGKGGFFGNDRPDFEASRARVCLACGHVMLALGAKALEHLRAASPHLAGLPDDA